MAVSTEEPQRPAVGQRLLAGRPFGAGYEPIEEHERRLGPRPLGTPELVSVLDKAGLKGRGGAWFPAGRKWAAVRRASQGNAVVVINGSEGEPLSAKDRTLLLYRPHLVFDGAALAAEALGASAIVLYLSRAQRGAERPIEQALAERERASRPEHPINVVKTAHRYIAGEATAVVNRVSGGPSKPKFSLYRTAERGVGDRPTLVQNAETLAHVAMIARYGADWFRKLGTAASPGSTLLTLCGNVRRPGVYEVNLGVPLGRVLQAAGGTFSPPAGALIGGYFGSWVPSAALNGLPLEPEVLKQHGSALGCGVVAVLPGDACGIVESSRILSYLAAESAAQCGPCVNGLNALAETMERVAASQPAPGDMENVTRWIGMVRNRGACHHPDGAVGQLASALGAFRDHLSFHLYGRPCAGTKSQGFPTPPLPGDRWR